MCRIRVDGRNELRRYTNSVLSGLVLGWLDLRKVRCRVVLRRLSIHVYTVFNWDVRGDIWVFGLR